MYGDAVLVRYCLACKAEFQPHVVRCSDCGAELVDRWLDEDVGVAAELVPEAEPPEPQVPNEACVIVAGDLLWEEAERAARQLRRAGVSFQVLAQGYGLGIGVPEDEVGAARDLLEKLRILPPSLVNGDAVGQVGGPCPACGAPARAGAEECEECGLRIGSCPDACPECGETLEDPGEVCGRCGARVS